MVNINKNGIWTADGNGVGKNLVPNQSQYTSESPYILQTNRTDGYVWFSNSAFEVEPSTQYTFSVRCNGVISNTHGNGGHSPSELPFTTWFYTCIEGTTKDWQHGYYDYARNFTSSYSTFRQEGNRYIWTYTTSATEKYIFIRLNGYSDGETIIQIKFWNFKVEKGSVATPWIPNPADTIYVSDSVGFSEEGDKAKIWSCGSVTGNEFIQF